MHRTRRDEADNVCGSAACRSLQVLLTEKHLIEGHICTSAHHPLLVIADSYTLARFVVFEVLQKLDSVGVLVVGLQAPFSFASEPFWKRSCG